MSVAFLNRQESEAQGSGEGKAESRRTMPCEITPDCSGKPTANQRTARTCSGKRGQTLRRSPKRAVQKNNKKLVIVSKIRTTDYTTN